MIGVLSDGTLAFRLSCSQLEQTLPHSKVHFNKECTKNTEITWLVFYLLVCLVGQKCVYVKHDFYHLGQLWTQIIQGGPILLNISWNNWLFCPAPRGLIELKFTVKVKTVEAWVMFINLLSSEKCLRMPVKLLFFENPICIALILKYQSNGTLKLDKIIDKVECGTLLGRTNCTSKYKSILIIIKWAFNQFEKPTLARADEVFIVWPLGCGLRNFVIGFCISRFNSSKFVLLSYNMNPSAIDVANSRGNYLAGFYNSKNKVYLKQLSPAFMLDN